MNKSLFGYLAHKFSSHPENLATEALAFVLNRSPVASQALTRFFATTGATIPGELHFRTQLAGGDNSIPDLVGVSKQNEQVVICEAKFWAGLTDNQPVTYLKREPRLLLFIAPSIRIATLWPEIVTRCKNAGLDPQSVNNVTPDSVVARISANQFLAATSWRVILNCLVDALASHGDQDSASDVRQLQGLCEQMDTEAFLPFRSEEFAPSIARCMLQFNELVDQVTDKLVEEKIATTAKLRATPTYHGYVRYMRVGQFGWILEVNSRYWLSIRETPIWLSIMGAPDGEHWRYSAIARERLSPLEHEQPPRLIHQSDRLLIPLRIPTGKEKEFVVYTLFVQLKEILEMLQPV